jgi:hypothetical protein
MWDLVGRACDSKAKKLCEPQLGTRKIAYADENRVEAEREKLLISWGLVATACHLLPLVSHPATADGADVN